MKFSDITNRIPLLLICSLGGGLISQPANAVVWADVRDTVITNNGVTNNDATANECTQCHSYLKTIAGNSSDPLSRHSAPSGANFDGATDLAAYNNITLLSTNYGAQPDPTYGFVDNTPDGMDNAKDRVYEWAADFINTGYMPMDPTVDVAPGPPDGIIDDYVDAPSDLNTTKKAAILNWALQGAPYAAATATTHTTVQGSNPTLVTGKTTATLKATVNTFVHSGTAVPGTHYFQYGTVASGTFGTTTSVVNRSSTSSAVITQAISGLSCGTAYQYRARSSNGNGTTTGSTSTLTTSACTDPVIAGVTIVANATSQSTTEDTLKDFPLSVSDDDPGSLQWSKTNGPNGSTVSLISATSTAFNGSATVRYTPAANLNGSNSDSFTVTVNNMNTGTSRTITFNMSITAVNDQPSITSTAPSSATEGVQYSYPVVVNDPDDAFGAGLSIALSNAPTGMTVNPSTGVITWTPGNGVASSGTVTVTVTDGGEDGAVAAVQMFSVSVTATNDPPSITSTAPTTATEDAQYSYTVGVSDIDDTNNGTDLTFSLSNQPAGMVVSTMGVITWTPLEGVLTSGTVTVQVADGGENGSLPDTENFTVTVTPVNDPPSITSADPSTTLTEGGAFSHQVTASDVDDTGGLGTDLSASLSNQPAAMAVNSTGLISWSVPRTGVFNNQYSNIVISVADGGEDGAVPDTLQFTLTVNPPDSDADGVADYADNCPSTPNGAAEDNQADNDGDTQYMANAGFPAIGDVDPSDPATGGNACDTDDDNDGMSDSFEATYSGAPCFLDPFDAADAALDCDGDGISNLDEFNASSAPDVDSVGPVVIAPADVTVNAKGYLTRVDIGVASAGDGNDGSISIIKPIVDATLSACSELSSYPLKAKAFRPGAHVVRWTTCDKAGNLSFDTQNVVVKPIINTTAGQTVGEGQVAVMKVRLNGPAAQYPVTVNYQAVAGIAGSSDHNASTGTISISQTDTEGNNPGLVGTLAINITDDGLAEDDEDFSISLSNASNAVLGAVKSHRFTIVGGDAQPIIDLAVMQAGNPTGPKVYGDAGNVVSVTATATDVRPSTVPSFDWSMTHNALSPIPANISSAANISTLTIDLSGVPAGNYPVTVEVNDNGRATTASLLLSVIATSPDVSDCNVDGTPDSNTDCDGDGVDNVTEGVTDSDADGIADYLDDNRIVDPAAVQNQSGDPSNSYLLTTDAGLRIRLGTTAATAGATGVLVSQQNIDEHGGQSGDAGLATADTYTNLGGYYDFEIDGLNNIVNTARLVIPLQSAILSGAVYRKYNGASWATFVENDLNSISSAKGELGVCPAPGSIEYTPGLTAFDFCVQLKLEDGGPNDADGVRNYVIRDPGGVALPPETVATPAAADGRLGALHPAWLLILVLPPLLLARRRAR